MPAGRLELLRPTALVQWAFYGSLFAIPYAQLYVPGTGDRLGVKRIVQALLLAAMFARPRVCLRLVPKALLWFLAYCVVRLIAGLWLAPEYAKDWWPSTLDLLQFMLPWTWLLFNVLQHDRMGQRGLWALALGAVLCALFHIAGIGTLDVDGGIEGRSTIFGANANEVGETYAMALVALVALGLFRSTSHGLRLAVFPLAGVVAVGLAKTGSRTGALMVALGILILLPQTRAFVSRTKRYLTLLLVAGVFAGVLYQIPTVLKRLAPVASSGATHEEARGRMIPVLWEIFCRSPIYGTGPDRYQYEMTRRALPYMAEKQRTICAHNLALLLLVETGVIGFVLFALGLGQSLLAAWRARSGACGLLPLAWLLPMTLSGLTISSPIFEQIFWVALAYALAGPSLAGARTFLSAATSADTMAVDLSSGRSVLNVAADSNAQGH
jgi:O-antigen ligase